MKKLLYVALTLLLIFSLASCLDIREPTIEVNDDGFVVVNGVVTDVVADKDDVITLDKDGSILVNGVKVNNKKCKNHTYGEWKLFEDGETDCEKQHHYRVCSECSAVDQRQGGYEDHSFQTVTTKPTCQAEGYDTKTCAKCGKVETVNKTPITSHEYGKEYLSDSTHHWRKCLHCDATDKKTAHKADSSGACGACTYPIGATAGIAYAVSTDGTYAEVVAYQGTAKKIRIAEEYNGLPVKSIGFSAFADNTAISLVIIPNSVTSIGDLAFRGCTSLTDLTIPDSITSIGKQVFKNCTQLKNVYIEDLSAWCSITFNGGDRYGGEYSNPLCYAKNLYLNGKLVTNLVIPKDIVSIGAFAFYGYASLTNVTIPNSVTIIGDYAFHGCTGLIYNEYDNACYLGNKDNPYLLLVKAKSNNITACNIHSDTKFIHNEAFRDCTSLTSVSIANSIMSIGNWAFNGCTGITSVHIKDLAAWCNISFPTRYENPLSYAGKLYLDGKLVTDLVIPKGVVSISRYAFYGCTGITSVTIGNDVKNIGNSAFYGCTDITSVTISDSVTDLGTSAFSGCTSLTSVTIGKGLTYIAPSAFYDCVSLTSITIPNSVSGISSSAFQGCASLSSITLPNGVTNIGDSAFQGCASLASITIPNSVTYLGDRAFQDCTALKTAAIGDTSTVDEFMIYVGQSVFYGCTSLTDVTIGNTLTSISNWMFRDCTSLTSITIGNNVETIGTSAFRNCISLVSIRYKGSEDEWNAINHGAWGQSTGTYTITYNYNE